AGARRGQHLARTQSAVGIEGCAKALHRRQIVLGEKLRHKGDFFHANAVLARHAAAACDALLENLATGGQHPLDLRRTALIEEQNRMDIAIAGVENVDDLNIVFLANLNDSPEDVRQLRPRHDAVLRAITGAQPADRAESLFSAFPKLLPLLYRRRLPHLAS